MKALVWVTAAVALLIGLGIMLAVASTISNVGRDYDICRPNGGTWLFCIAGVK